MAIEMSPLVERAALRIMRDLPAGRPVRVTRDDGTWPVVDIRPEPGGYAILLQVADRRRAWMHLGDESAAQLVPPLTREDMLESAVEQVEAGLGDEYRGTLLGYRPAAHRAAGVANVLNGGVYSDHIGPGAPRWTGAARGVLFTHEELALIEATVQARCAGWRRGPNDEGVAPALVAQALAERDRRLDEHFRHTHALGDMGLPWEGC